MKQNQKILLFTCLSLALIFSLLFVSMHLTRQNLKSGIYMYDNIDECLAFEALDITDGKFTAYSDAASDKYISGFEYAAFFGGTFSCKAYDLRIFAYEFNDTVTAQQYFQKATGRDSNGMDKNYSLVSGMFSSRLVVFRENKAYAIFFPTSALADVTQLLSEIFSVKLD